MSVPITFRLQGYSSCIFAHALVSILVYQMLLFYTCDIGLPVVQSYSMNVFIQWHLPRS